MNRIEIIDRILEFYNTPGNKSGHCNLTNLNKYYVDDTAKCAIGCLLDDPIAVQVYANHTNSYSIRYIGETATHDITNPEAKAILAQIKKLLPDDIVDDNPNIFENKKYQFLDTLQCLHDNYATNHTAYAKFLEKMTTALNELKETIQNEVQNETT